MKGRLVLAVFLLSNILCYSVKAQILTREDSLNAGLDPNHRNVILAGYGEAKVSVDQNLKTANANLTRSVLFVGYRFTPKITFFSEMELEDARVSATGGGISMEQCVLKFDLNHSNYLLAGLMIPRIGLLNENHLPITFNGNDRHFVEQMIIPATWREMGVGYYGSSSSLPGLNWSVALLNGLNASRIGFGQGIRDARFGGRDATASNVALTAALLYYRGGFRLQASGYYGGSAGFTQREADSLRLNSGLFGTPVALTEANMQFRHNGFVLKALATYVYISQAQKLNAAFASNAPQVMYGYYAELGYNLLQGTRHKDKQCNIFTRYERLDMLAAVPENGIDNDILNQQYLITGITYLPIRNVAIKFDWTHKVTGEPNPAMIFNPSPNAPPYLRVNNFYQMGMAYSF
ncbi:hypothetical protein GC194_06715 [bacterium]|nr:hypothetical protein [bacterium]